MNNGAESAFSLKWCAFCYYGVGLAKTAGRTKRFSFKFMRRGTERANSSLSWERVPADRTKQGGGHAAQSTDLETEAGRTRNPPGPLDSGSIAARAVHASTLERSPDQSGRRRRTRYYESFPRRPADASALQRQHRSGQKHHRQLRSPAAPGLERPALLRRSPIKPGYEQLWSPAHNQPNGSTSDSRIAASGYTNTSSTGENAYAYAQSVDQAMKAFLIDWGVSDSGHRDHILQPVRRRTRRIATWDFRWSARRTRAWAPTSSLRISAARMVNPLRLWGRSSTTRRAPTSTNPGRASAA